MNALIHILARSGLLTKDLDYHLIRASTVLILLAFGYQKWFAYEAQVLIPFISNVRSFSGCIRCLGSAEPVGF